MDQLDLGLEPRESKGARLSDDGHYRYSLWRRWEDGPLLGWVMMNPSVADDEVDDHTIRCCTRVARDGGFGGIYVVNLYAWRATKPDDLWRASSAAEGPDNDHEIVYAAENERIGLFVAAWGAVPPFTRARVRRVTGLLVGSGRQLHCLGVTRNGSPRHPSRVSVGAKLVAWTPR